MNFNLWAFPTLLVPRAISFYSDPAGMRTGLEPKDTWRRAKESMTKLIDGSKCLINWTLKLMRNVKDCMAFCFILFSTLSTFVHTNFSNTETSIFKSLFFLKRTRKVKGTEGNTKNNFRRLLDASFWILVLTDVHSSPSLFCFCPSLLCTVILCWQFKVSKLLT